MEENLPDVVAEVTAAFERYNAALEANDTPVLNELFRHSPYTVRFGHGENLFGYDAIASFRAGSKGGAPRRLERLSVNSFGRDYATTMAVFRREGLAGTMRQMQCWVRTPDGWRIAAAHVSVLRDG